MHEMIMQPEFLRIDGYRWYRFVLGGCMWLFIASSHSKNFKFKEFFLNKEGKLVIHLQAAENIEFITRLTKDLRKEGKFS